MNPNDQPARVDATMKRRVQEQQPIQEENQKEGTIEASLEVDRHRGKRQKLRGKATREDSTASSGGEFVDMEPTDSPTRQATIGDDRRPATRDADGENIKSSSSRTFDGSEKKISPPSRNTTPEPQEGISSPVGEQGNSFRSDTDSNASDRTVRLSTPELEYLYSRRRE